MMCLMCQGLGGWGKFQRWTETTIESCPSTVEEIKDTRT